MDLYKSEEWQKAQKGELYRAFVPELVAARDRCNKACNKFNSTSDTSRRNLVKLWREITCDTRPLPPPATAAAAISTNQPSLPTENVYMETNNTADEDLFKSEPWIMPPMHADYGINIQIEPDTFVNFNATFVDTCLISIGSRTLIGPNCSFYSGTHPVDPAIRNGMIGPESGAPIKIGPDCWLGGNVTVLPGVTIGQGTTIGAGSVVVKDIPAFVVAAGSPCRVLRKIETKMAVDHDNTKTHEKDGDVDATVAAKGPDETSIQDAEKVQERLTD